MDNFYLVGSYSLLFRKLFGKETLDLTKNLRRWVWVKPFYFFYHLIKVFKLQVPLFYSLNLSNNANKISAGQVKLERNLKVEEILWIPVCMNIESVVNQSPVVIDQTISCVIRALTKVRMYSVYVCVLYSQISI